MSFITTQLLVFLLPIVASTATAFWMRHRMYADDGNWFENFWNALVAGITTLWNALLHGLMWMFAFETMYRSSLIRQWAKEREAMDERPYTLTTQTSLPTNEPVQLSSDGRHFVDALMQIASAGKITLGSPSQPIERERWMPDMQGMLAQGMRNDEPVDIDYEQPQTMYPELPEMEYEQ